MKYLLLIFLFVSCGKPFFKASGDNDILNQSFVKPSEVVFTKANIDLDFYFNDDIVLYDENKMTLEFRSIQGLLIDPPYKIEVYIWMPDMGHGSFPISVSKKSEGIYQLNDIYFTMPGLWDFHFILKEGETIVDEFVWPITL